MSFIEPTPHPKIFSFTIYIMQISKSHKTEVREIASKIVRKNRNMHLFLTLYFRKEHRNAMHRHSFLYCPSKPRYSPAPRQNWQPLKQAVSAQAIQLLEQQLKQTTLPIFRGQIIVTYQEKLHMYKGKTGKQITKLMD